MDMETMPLALSMTLVNHQMLLLRITCTVALTTITMVMQMSKMPVTMMTGHLGLTVRDATITTKMAGQIIISTTLMETFSHSIGNSLLTVMETAMEIILGLTVVLQNTIRVNLMVTCSHLTHHNTKTKMVMAGVTTPQTL